MRQYISTLLVIILVSACSTRPSVPRSFPDEDKMALVIADMYQTESVLGQTRLSYVSSKEDKVSGYYRFVLDKHGLTKAEFDTAMGWYSAHPIVLSDVYEQAIEELSRRDAELKNKINKEKDAHSSVARMPDRQGLWNDTTAYKLSDNLNDSVDNRLPFKLEFDSLCGGILRLHANYTFKEGSLLDSAQMKLMTLYADSAMDTTYYHIHKSFKKVSGNISHSIPSNKYLIGIEGFLFSHDTTKSVVVDVDGVKLTFIPTFRGEEMMIK